MTDQIKPCPFPKCKNSSVGVFCRNGWHVECDTCGCRGPCGVTESDAVSLWNAAPRLTPAERAVLDAAVAYAKAMDERWRGPDAEDLERKGEVRLALNVLLGGARTLARERRGGGDGQ